MTRRFSSATKMVLIAISLAAAMTQVARAAARSAHGSSPHRATRVLPARGSLLPDSVLARVGDRSITVSAFLVARRDMPGPPPDSLTPQAARGFLELLVNRELLTQEARRTRWTWTDAESAQFALTRDHMRLRSALEAELGETRQAVAAGGDTALTEQALGIAARERTVERLNVEFDDAAIARLTHAFAAVPKPSADSSLGSQIAALSTLPQMAPEDAHAMLAGSIAGDYRVDDLLEAWGKLSPAYRPRVETEEQVRDLVLNGLFERALRARAERITLSRSDLDALERERERIEAAHLIERDVIGRIPRDVATLERFHRQHAAEWSLPTRVRALRLQVTSREDAQDLAAGIRDAASAESLAARARRNGIDYMVEASATSDSALFATGIKAAPGSVVGPEPIGQDWWVARIEAVLPGRSPEFSEVRGDVERRWVEAETERRLGLLCAHLRTRTHVAVNQPALERRSWTSGPERRAARD